MSNTQKTLFDNNFIDFICFLYYNTNVCENLHAGKEFFDDI